MSKENRLEKYRSELKKRAGNHTKKAVVGSVATVVGTGLTFATGGAAIAAPILTGGLAVSQVDKRNNYTASNNMLKSIIKCSKNDPYQNAAYEIAGEAFERSGLYLGEKKWTRRVFPQKTVYILGGILLALHEDGLRQKERFTQKLAEYLEEHEKPDDIMTTLAEKGKKTMLHFETGACNPFLVFKALTGKDEPTSAFYQELKKDKHISQHIPGAFHRNSNRDDVLSGAGMAIEGTGLAIQLVAIAAGGCSIM